MNFPASRRLSPSLYHTSALSGALVGAMLMCTAAANAYATDILPKDPTVVSGKVSFSQPDSHTLNVTSVGNSLTNWGSFNVGAPDTVNFKMSSSNAISLNRDISGQLSKIDGTINANGHVWIVNNQGVFIGQGAHINVAGFIASASNISDQNFMAGHYLFDQPGNPNASIINEGSITAEDGGLVALVAPSVRNDGIITAHQGEVVLASGEAPTVDFYGDGLYSFALNGGTGSGSVVNTGTIDAKGGTVLMTVAQADNVLNQVIDTSGVVTADDITLDAKTGDVTLDGTLDASGKPGGGDINVYSNNLTFGSHANITAGQGGHAYLDPTDMTIDSNAANTIDNTLNTGSNVNFQSSGALTLASNISKTAGGDANLTLTAGSDITFISLANITSSSGKLNTTLDANTAGHGGAITLNDGAFINSNGGDITLGGGANPLTTAAVGDLLHVSGVTLNGAILNASGGNITVNGAGSSISSADTNRYGVNIANGFNNTIAGTIQTSGSGTITVNGTGGSGDNGTGGNGLNFNYGINILGVVGALNNIQSENGAITINGTGGGTGMGNHGVNIRTNANINSVNGNINITGAGSTTNTSTGNNAADQGNSGIVTSGYVSTSGTGNINLSGTAGGNVVNNSGVEVDGGSLQATGSGNINVTGNGSATAATVGGGSTGINLNAPISTNTGNITLTGNGTSTGGGVNINNTSVSSTGGGNITVTGNASAGYGINLNTIFGGAANVSTTGAGAINFTGTSDHGYGIIVFGNFPQTPISISTQNGDINFNATSTGTSTGKDVGGDDGMEILAANFTSNDGNINLSGTGSASGITNPGILMTSIQATTTGKGNINVSGIGGGTGTMNNGVQMMGGGLQATGSGNITVVGVASQTAGATSQNYGVFTNGSGDTITTSTGDITLAGIASQTGTAGSNIGTDLGSTTISSTGGGNVYISGVGGTGSNTSGAGNNQGINMTMSTVSTVGSGVVNLTGTGGGTGTGNQGIYLEGNGNGITAVDGNVTITGTGASGGNALETDGFVTALSGNGSLTVNAPSNGNGNVLLGNNSFFSTSNSGNLIVNAHNVSLIAGALSTDNGALIVNNTGVFSGYTASLSNTSTGTGSVTLNQNVGGSIQNAINAVGNTGTGGAFLNLGAGTWTESSVINRSNYTQWGFTVTGQGAANTIVKASGSNPAFGVYSSLHVNLEQMKVDGQHTAAGIAYNNSSGDIGNMEVANATGAGGNGTNFSGGAIYANDSNSGAYVLSIHDSNVHDFQQGGILINGLGYTALVSNNTVTGTNSTASSLSGVTLANNATGSVTGNTISNIAAPAAAGATGISLYQAGTGITVAGNTITGNGTDTGIKLTGTSLAYVNHNVITGTKTGIFNGASSTFSGTINSNGNNIDFNQISVPVAGGTGIVLTKGSDYTNIISNTITGIAGNPTQAGTGISTDQSNYMTIDSNDISGFGTGVSTTGNANLVSTLVNITNNTIHNVDTGVYAYDTRALSIHSNTMTSSSLDGSTGVSISGDPVTDGSSHYVTRSISVGSNQINDFTNAIVASNIDTANIGNNPGGIIVGTAANIGGNTINNTRNAISITNGIEIIAVSNTINGSADAATNGTAVAMKDVKSSSLWSNNITGFDTGASVTGTSLAGATADTVNIGGPRAGDGADFGGNTFTNVTNGIVMNGVVSPYVNNNTIHGTTLTDSTGIIVNGGKFVRIGSNVVDTFATGIISSNNIGGTVIGDTYGSNILTNVVNGISATNDELVLIDNNSLTGTGAGTGIDVTGSTEPALSNPVAGANNISGFTVNCTGSGC